MAGLDELYLHYLPKITGSGVATSLISQIRDYKKQTTSYPELQEFQYFPEISARGADNTKFYHFLKNNLVASPNLEVAATEAMFNLPYAVPKEGATKKEREHIKNQLNHYLSTIACLEVKYSKDNACSLGRFKNKKTSIFGDIYSFKDSGILSDNKKYDLIYLDNPRKITDNAIEVILPNLFSKKISEGSMDFLMDKVETPSHEELTGFAKEAGSLVFYLIDERNHELYLKSIATIEEPKQKEGAMKIFILLKGISEELKSEWRHFLDEECLIASFSKKLKPNGILLVDSTEKYDIDELRYISGFKVPVYQN